MVKYSKWKHSEDLILVQCITEVVSQGRNYMEAFPIASLALGKHRTTGACYSRWNSRLKDIYEPSVTLAQKKATDYIKEPEDSVLDSLSTFKDAIDFISNINGKLDELTNHNELYQKELNEVYEAMDEISQENEILKRHIVSLETGGVPVGV